MSKVCNQRPKKRKVGKTQVFILYSNRDPLARGGSRPNWDRSCYWPGRAELSQWEPSERENEEAVSWGWTLASCWGRPDTQSQANPAPSQACKWNTEEKELELRLIVEFLVECLFKWDREKSVYGRWVNSIVGIASISSLTMFVKNLALFVSKVEKSLWARHPVCKRTVCLLSVGKLTICAFVCILYERVNPYLRFGEPLRSLR